MALGTPIFAAGVDRPVQADVYERVVREFAHLTAKNA